MKALGEYLHRLDSNLWNTRLWRNRRPAEMQEPIREGLARQAKQVEPLERLGKVFG